MTDARLHLMSGFQLEIGGRTVDVATPAQRVLAFLALNARPVSRSHIARALWRDSGDARAAGSLRSALWRIRRYGALVDLAPRGVSLNEAVRVDVREATSWARRVSDASHALRDDDVQFAAASGELLPEWDDEWVSVEREHVRQVRLHALEILSERLVSERRFGLAIEAALASLRADPLRESAHRAVVAVHLAEGNRSEALRHFREYDELLRVQLGIEPTVLMRRLVTADEVRLAAV
jgi:DNA-binding SARP family transcriptional activator